MTDRDSRTRTRARAPGAEGDPPSMAVHHHGRRPGAVRDNRPDPEVHEGRRQTGRQQAHAGSRLKPLTSGKAPPDRPAFQPYWGKPAVRNERGDRGNVGIIRSPVRASILPNTRRVADFEVRLNRDPFVIADRLWVKVILDPEEEKLRFSK